MCGDDQQKMQTMENELEIMKENVDEHTQEKVIMT